MRVNLLTDAPKHNLALMKISAYHKAQGDTIVLNEPMNPCDVSYGSYLFRRRDYTDFVGGPAVDPGVRLNGQFAGQLPDYDLFPGVDYSLGYTWEYCPRQCEFCCVPKQHPPRVHHSIREFHDPRFKKICLLNNNTFSDPRWRETFEEIWEAGLMVIDENGYDLRLMDGERAEALRRMRFFGYIHFAWDQMGDEEKVVEGLDCLKRVGFSSGRAMVYVLVGWPDYRPIDETDIYRCQRLVDLGWDPFVMVYRDFEKPLAKGQARQFKQFSRLVNRSWAWRSSLREAWEHYEP